MRQINQAAVLEAALKGDPAKVAAIALGDAEGMLVTALRELDRSNSLGVSGKTPSFGS